MSGYSRRESLIIYHFCFAADSNPRLAIVDNRDETRQYEHANNNLDTAMNRERRKIV